MNQFRPSQVSLSGVPPLVGTMGKSEAEAAAAVLVAFLSANGDEWRPVSSHDVLCFLLPAIDDNKHPLAHMLENPFWNPEPNAIVDLGFGTWVRDDSIELTPSGIETLRPFVGLRD